jgi:hypothetical protein
MTHDWQAEMAQERKDKAAFKELAAQVAARLDMTLDPDAECWGARIGAPDGRGYFLGFPHKGKTEISPMYPQSSFGFYQTERGRIGVSVSRGAAVIAAEINRRLAPLYAANLAKVLDYEADLAVDQGARSVLADKLAGLFPDGCTHSPDHRQSERETELIVNGPGLGGGSVRYSGGGGEVTIGGNHGFRVPAGVATQMLAIYGDYMRDQAEHRISVLGMTRVTADAETECRSRGRWCMIQPGQQAARDANGDLHCLAHLPE